MGDDEARQRSREILAEVISLRRLERMLEERGHSRTRRALTEGCKTGRIIARQIDDRGTWLTTNHEALLEVERVVREDAQEGA